MYSAKESPPEKSNVPVYRMDLVRRDTEMSLVLHA